MENVLRILKITRKPLSCFYEGRESEKKGKRAFYINTWHGHNKEGQYRGTGLHLISKWRKEHPFEGAWELVVLCFVGASTVPFIHSGNQMAEGGKQR